MPPVARVGDVTSHGTPLTGTGSPDVFVGGMPAYRVGLDTHSCPLVSGVVPHVGGPVAMGSTSVMINDVPAVRMGDIIVESAPPNTIAAGEPTVVIGGGSTSAEPAWVAGLYERLSGYVDAHNGAIDGTDLGILGAQLAGEIVNLFVSDPSGEGEFSFRTDSTLRIEAFERGSREDATVRMETDRETVDRIADAEAPVEEFQEAVVDGSVTITGIGTANEVKWGVINWVRGVGAFFGLA